MRVNSREASRANCPLLLLGLGFHDNLRLKMPKRIWTDEKRRFLVDNYQRMTNIELAESLNTTLSAVKTKLKVLGLTRRSGWTREMDNFLRTNYRRATKATLAHKLGKTVSAIDNRLFILKHRRFKQYSGKWIKWTPEKLQFLQDNYETMSNALLARKLRSTKNAVAKQLSRMGLVRKHRD